MSKFEDKTIEILQEVQDKEQPKTMRRLLRGVTTKRLANFKFMDEKKEVAKTCRVTPA